MISQQPMERSYHIFYQIMSDALPGLKGSYFRSCHHLKERFGRSNQKRSIHSRFNQNMIKEACLEELDIDIGKMVVNPSTELSLSTKVHIEIPSE